MKPEKHLHTRRSPEPPSELLLPSIAIPSLLVPGQGEGFSLGLNAHMDMWELPSPGQDGARGCVRACRELGQDPGLPVRPHLSTFHPVPPSRYSRQVMGNEKHTVLLAREDRLGFLNRNVSAELRKRNKKTPQNSKGELRNCKFLSKT